MGIVGGTSRHYKGGKLDPEGLGTIAGTGWTCPTCKALNAGPVEAGCGSCGAGTAAQAEAAKIARQGALVKDDRLQELLCGKADLHTAVALPGLEPRARMTIARALAHYAETSTPGPDELPRVAILTWARRVMEAVDAMGPIVTDDPNDWSL